MWATKFHTHTKQVSVPKPTIITIVDSRVSVLFRRGIHDIPSVVF